MSTIKISQLPQLPVINSNTANTLFVVDDITGNQTGTISATVLSKQLYSNNSLIVGQNQSLFPNTIAQFSLSGDSYVQTNFVNLNGGGTADHVITANNGTDAAYFLDLGLANPGYVPGSEYNNIGTAVSPLDGYLYMQGGSTAGFQGGNLIIGTTTTNTEIKFMASGGTFQNVIAKMTSTGLKMVNGNKIFFSDGTSQNTAAATLEYTQAAYALANATNTTVTYVSGVDLGQNTFAAAAFAKANGALANASGTFAGNLAITGSVTANTGNIGNLTISNNTIYSSATGSDMIIGQAGATANLVINRTTNITKDLTITGNIVSNGILVDFNNPNFDPNIPFVQITGTSAAYQASNANYMLQITGKANTTTRLVVDSFGQNTYPVLVGRMGRGSSLAPAATQNNDVMMRIVGNGFTGTQFPSSSPTKIDFVAGENFTDTARGTRIEFWNTTIGGNTIQKIASFNAQDVLFTGHVEPIKGFVYTPTIYPSAQTAISIDMANNSVVRAQTATGLVVTLTNLLAGKEVVAWITNTAGTNQTFTHGCSAINSTVNSTTYNIPATSSIFVRYWSMDGTLQNTFSSITHA
jgi:hypothetical protein